MNQIHFFSHVNLNVPHQCDRLSLHSLWWCGLSEPHSRILLTGGFLGSLCQRNQSQARITSGSSQSQHSCCDAHCINGGRDLNCSQCASLNGYKCEIYPESGKLGHLRHTECKCCVIWLVKSSDAWDFRIVMHKQLLKGIPDNVFNTTMLLLHPDARHDF